MRQQPPPQRPSGYPTAPPPAAARAPRAYPEVEVVDEFDEDQSEEISEEEFIAERRRLRRSRKIGTVTAIVSGFLLAIIVFALLFDQGFFLVDNFDATPLTATDISAPEVPDWDPNFGEPPPPTSGGVTPGMSYSISWTTSHVFVERGGVMRVNLTNKGATQIYVERIMMVPEWAGVGDVYRTSFGRFIDPGQEVFIGLLGFTGPSAPGLYTYHFELDLLVKRPVLMTWASIEGEDSRDQEMQVLPAEVTSGYPIHTNDDDIYRRVNDLVEPNDPSVATIADQIRQGLGDSYNLFWIASLFEWVLQELEYRSDPSDDDVWSPASDTCSVLEGDCEDFSIVIASVVEHWGGNARFYVISKHAFAAVYVGGTDMDTVATASALDRFYGTSVRYSWFRDELGYWIIADGTASSFLGGLPYNGVATDLQGSWDIRDTEYLYITDIYPDYPE